jgi:hypothetical protein
MGRSTRDAARGREALPSPTLVIGTLLNARLDASCCSRSMGALSRLCSALSRQSDRDLNDLGIHRSDIRAVASGAVWPLFPA